MNKNTQNPLHSPELERALKKRAKEDLERKAMEKARNEYNYEQYLKRQKQVEVKARFKLRKKSIYRTRYLSHRYDFNHSVRIFTESRYKFYGSYIRYCIYNKQQRGLKPLCLS